MTIDNFDDLLLAARAQALPQRLLFVFTEVSLPDDSTAQQQANFDARQGGALEPKMCVDKHPDELESFGDLVREAEQFEQPWGMVFAAALSGLAGHAPSSADADLPLQAMVEAIKRGDIGNYLLFDRQGMPVQLW
jgi:hypothetical protein